MIRLVMENAGLTLWPMLSLALFMLSSACVLAWLFRPGSAAFYGRLSRLAFSEDRDGTDPEPRGPERREGEG